MKDFKVKQRVKLGGKYFAAQATFSADPDSEAVKELLELGAIEPVGAPASQPADKLEGEALHAAIRDAADKLDSGDLNQDGRPKVKPLSAALGFAVNSADIKATFAGETKGDGGE